MGLVKAIVAEAWCAFPSTFYSSLFSFIFLSLNLFPFLFFYFYSPPTHFLLLCILPSPSIVRHNIPILSVRSKRSDLP